MAAAGAALRRLPVAPDDSAHCRVVRRDIHFNRVTRNYANHPALAHLARCAGGHLVTGLQLHAECGVGQRLNDNALRPEIVVFACDESLQSVGPTISSN